MIQWSVPSAAVVVIFRDANRTLADIAKAVAATRGEILEAFEYLDAHPITEAVRLLNLRGRRA